MDREWKGHMRRRFDRRLWTLILSLFLIGGGSLSLPGAVRADITPTDPAPGPPPDGGTGDPDWPQGPARSPKPGPTRGASNPSRENSQARRGGMLQWMKWSFGVVYGSIYRILFRV